MCIGGVDMQTVTKNAHMQIVTLDTKGVTHRPETKRWFKQHVHRRHRHAVKVWLKTGFEQRNQYTPLTGWGLD
jgi:hypothetical protein